MRRLLTALLDSVFPPTNHHQQLRQPINSISQFYNPCLYKGTIYLTNYSDPTIQAAIIENKFHHRTEATQLLADILQNWIDSRSDELLFIPVPLGTKRLRERGYNQVESILKKINPTPNTTTNVLRRQNETTPQSQLGKRERIQNMRNAFTCDKTQVIQLAGKHIVILDDVITTGATLEAAQAAISIHLPPNTVLTCLAIAH